MSAVRERVDQVTHSPVFVDASGRRRRWVSWALAATAALCAGYLILLVFSFTGGPLTPRDLLPLPDPPKSSQPDQDAVRPTTAPSPGTTPAPGTTPTPGTSPGAAGATSGGAGGTSGGAGATSGGAGAPAATGGGPAAPVPPAPSAPVPTSAPPVTPDDTLPSVTVPPVSTEGAGLPSVSISVGGGGE
jgi:hypothetical protein